MTPAGDRATHQATEQRTGGWNGDGDDDGGSPRLVRERVGPKRAGEGPEGQPPDDALPQVGVLGFQTIDGGPRDEGARGPRVGGVVRCDECAARALIPSRSVEKSDPERVDTDTTDVEARVTDPDARRAVTRVGLQHGDPRWRRVE